MKLEAFLIIFSYLFIELLAKTISDGIENNNSTLKEYTYKIKNYEEEIKVERNSLVTIELNNFPPYGAEWFYNDFGNIDILEYKGKEVKSTCTRPDDTECESITLFQFLVKEVTEKDIFPVLEFDMFRDDKNINSKVVVYVRMLLKEEEPLNEQVYTLGFGNTEVIVEPNSLLILEMVNNSTSPEYRFSLFNPYELTQSGLIEFKKVNYKSSCNTLTVEPRRSGCGETSVFTFLIKDVTDEKLLPTLRFSNENLLMSYFSTNIMEITLKLPRVDFMGPVALLKEYSYQVSEDTEIIVGKNSLVKIELEVQLSMGYSWLISNANEVKDSGMIDIYGTNYSSCNGKIDCTETAMFTFHIKKVMDDSLLPPIKFIYENRMMSSLPDRQVSITLKLDPDEEGGDEEPEDEMKTFTYQIDNSERKVEVIVEPHSTLILELGHNSTTPSYEWNLYNLNRIVESEYVEFQSVSYKSSCERSGKVVCGKIGVFTFLIKDIPDVRLLPTLQFSNVNMAMSSFPTDIMDITLRLEGKDEIVEPEAPYQEYVYHIKNENDTEIIVESHSMLKIDLDINLALGYEWTIDNQDEIKNSGLIDIYGIQDNSSYTRIWFRIKEVTDETLLPKLKFTYYNRKTSPEYNISKKTIEVTLKLKEDPSKVCSFKNYPCCSKPEAKVYYHDADGDWGVEHGEWCFIKTTEEEQSISFITIVTTGPTTTTSTSTKTSSPPTIPSTPECFSLKYGYPCCQSNTPEDIVYTDSDGDWGKENHQWCGITLQ